MPETRPASETRVRVRYAETDQMGVVYHANYLIWMEIGRTDHCQRLGFRYRDMEAEDRVMLAVVEAQCRYLSPARYDDEVIVRTTITEVGSRLIRFGYEMRHAENGRVLATGETRHVFVGADMRPTKMPARHRGMFGLA